MKTIITSIALAASLFIVSNANAQTVKALIQEQPQQLIIDHHDDHHVEWQCARLGFRGIMIPGQGIRVLWVNPGGQASRIGLEPGDVLNRINGVLITSDWQYRSLLQEAIQYRGGHLDILVRNVRYDWGHAVPKWVNVHTHLYCGSYYGGGYGGDYAGVGYGGGNPY